MRPTRATRPNTNGLLRCPVCQRFARLQPGDTTVDLVLTDDRERPWWRQTFNSVMRQPSLRRAGIPAGRREDGTHALRHYYASALLDGGRVGQAVSEYLGHSDPGFTLRT